ncbi:MAG: serpin family protein, partial [Gemmatimonadaceae bacterium]
GMSACFPESSSRAKRGICGAIAGALLATSLATSLAACGAGSVEPTPSRPAAPTSLPRNLTPAEQDVLSAANAFSFSLWGAINRAQRDSNVFVSPLSASFALGMTMNGAAGQTYDEMRSALQFGGASLASIDSGYKSLIALLTGLDPLTTMQIANSIFYRKDFPFTQSFLSDASTWFDAEVKPQDFADVTGTLSAVNGWASAKTNGRIPTVLEEVTPDEVMFLLNAIYFKGTWRDKFDASLTHDDAFHPATGSDQTAKLMFRDGKMAYAETNAFQAVDLAYGDSAFTMTVLLPKPGSDVEQVAASLTPSAWQSLTASFVTREVELTFPKVTFSWKRSLKDDMRSLGMQAAFVPDGADFTRMSSLGQHLYISLLQQNTFVAIDEEGTEAAAVTLTGITATAAPVATEMRVDRPYVIVIRERLSGTILFMGKIARMPS